MLYDLISRRAAIAEIEKYFAGLPIRARHDVLAIIRELPSAHDEMLVICDNCGHAIHIKREEQDDALAEAYAAGETAAEAKYHDMIVRCKDCVYYDGLEDGKLPTWMKPWCKFWIRATNEDAYCSQAERKSDG